MPRHMIFRSVPFLVDMGPEDERCLDYEFFRASGYATVTDLASARGLSMFRPKTSPV
jgi:hypothetical protein